ncbi:MAG TPA: polyphosphate kinase 1 [Longimicrobiaceae bacterium]|nr:polyphosphate kinase 1 [Longimicrobiaceae bacterium]
MSEVPANSTGDGVKILEAAAAEAAAAKVSLDPSWLLNMELSHLEFQDRVVDLAADPGVPLLERVRFLSILGGNLDEFFMTRVAGFKRQIALGNEKKTLDGHSPQEQLRLIHERVRELLARVHSEVMPEIERELAKHGIEIASLDDLGPRERKYLEANYVPQLDAVVSPWRVPKKRPFPHVRNLRPALLVRLADDGKERLTVVELPGDVPKLVPLPGGRRLVPLEDVIRMSLPRLLDGLDVTGSYVFRVTRSGNLLQDAENPDDMVEALAETVARRPFQPVVRLEVEAAMPDALSDTLLDRLAREAERRLSALGEEDRFEVDRLVDLRRLDDVASLPIPELRYLKLRRTVPFKPKPSIFAQLRNRDVLVRFPMHSFERSVERFLQEAAVDPAVEAICITLYRTNRASKVVKLLQRAHQQGKEVLAMIEVKASFDERRNIEWARTLEAAGIQVRYGHASLKVHAKIASVRRREGDGVRLYSFVGTGNLNASTAAAYTDLGLLTADRKLGEELAAVFATFEDKAESQSYETLVVAPFNMRQRFLELIEREIEHARAGHGGRMTVKLNGIADREIIAQLYRASSAGVRMDLIVRGICSVRPGIRDVSENIRVISVVGRFLEHSRIFRFDNAGDPEYYIGSADWRGRNLSRRIEVVAPVPSPGHQKILDEILAADLDSPNAWELQPDGRYLRLRGGRAAGRSPRVANGG